MVGIVYRQRPLKVMAIRWDGDLETFTTIRSMIPEHNQAVFVLTCWGALVALVGPNRNEFVSRGQWVAVDDDLYVRIFEDEEFQKRFEHDES